MPYQFIPHSIESIELVLEDNSNIALCATENAFFNEMSANAKSYDAIGICFLSEHALDTCVHQTSMCS